MEISTNWQSVFLLLVLFQVKHFIADFPLQRPYMLRKGEDNWSFVVPLAMHSAVHATFSLLIILMFNTSLWWLFFVDFFVHFVVDRIKSGPRYLGRFNDVAKSPFWISLGFDQMLHHCTNYFMIYQLMSHL